MGQQKIAFFLGGGGGGWGNPLYVPPQRIWLLRRFGQKPGINVAHFGLESGMVFKGTTVVHERIYCFNSE